MPETSRAGHADFLAILRDIRGHEDLWVVRVVIVVLEVDLGTAELVCEIHVLRIGQALILEEQELVTVDQLPEP